ncbi:MAG: energy transducer TonB [Chitinophagaceae bacterium]|nr:energy transducer TonB [Chitinophagaceae bacterium]
MKALTFAILLLPAGLLQANAQTDSIRKVIVLDSTVTKVEIESEFPGGGPAWLEFLNKHVRYPKKAWKNGIQGIVVLQFIVDKDGSISDAKALTGDPLLQEAALKVLRESPKWIPATINGRSVKSYKKQPISFKLEPAK